MHQEDTKANWIRVRVIGLGKTLRMDFDEVLVRAELMYQMRQRTCFNQNRSPHPRESIVL